MTDEGQRRMKAMLNCEEAQSSIGRLVDGTITPRVLEPLRAHLAECPACQEEADTQLQVRQLLASREPEPLPSGFSERLSARLAQERPLALQPGSWFDRANWRKWSIYLLPAAAVLVIFATRATMRDAAKMRKAVRQAESATVSETGRPSGTSQESVLEWIARPDTTDDSLLVLLVTGDAPARPKNGKN
jgi:anti-sigma factor (TIGR02949 family)